jgi:hypothetical protein
MKLKADLQAGTLVVGDKAYSISNIVRTLRDGTRRSWEVVRSIPDNIPYDPAPFPRGEWKVTSIEWQKKRGFDANTYGPVKIRTDAFQTVECWLVDGDGDYKKPSGIFVKDSGYLLHYSQSNTTLGCIRLASPQNAIDIANAIQAAFDVREPVTLEVV